MKSKASAVPTTMTRMTSELTQFLMTMPSMMWAAVSVASIACSSTANMSFQRITTIGSIPLENSEATRVAGDPVALVLEPVDLDPVVVEVLEVAQVLEQPGRAARRTATRTSVSAWACVHRRLDLVEAEEVGGLLGVVDDVVDLGREA